MELVLGRSLAGHDKDRIYVVLGEQGQDLILSDGRYKLIDHPKTKRKKHVQLIKHFPNLIRETARDFEKWDDDNIKKVISLYHKEEGNCQRQM